MPAILTNSLSCSSRLMQRRTSQHTTRRSSKTSRSYHSNRQNSNNNNASSTYFVSSSCSSSRSSSSTHSPRPSASIDTSLYSEYLLDRSPPNPTSSITATTTKSSRQRGYFYFPQENKDQSRTEEWGHFVEV
jgi:hypothetical protein